MYQVVGTQYELAYHGESGCGNIDCQTLQDCINRCNMLNGCEGIGFSDAGWCTFRTSVPDLGSMFYPTFLSDSDAWDFYANTRYVGCYYPAGRLSTDHLSHFACVVAQPPHRTAPRYAMPRHAMPCRAFSHRRGGCLWFTRIFDCRY